MGQKQLLWFLACIFALFSRHKSTAQEVGPVIPGYGKVYHIANADIPSSPEMEFWVVFDVYDSTPSGKAYNPQLETAARFLNLHAGSGVAVDKLKVALVVQGRATEELLGPEAYKDKHGIDNPNAGLIGELLRAGVQIAICGQSAGSRGISKEQTIPGVQWALSAMTALVYYQNKGYQFIKF